MCVCACVRACVCVCVWMSCKSATTLIAQLSFLAYLKGQIALLLLLLSLSLLLLFWSEFLKQKLHYYYHYYYYFYLAAESDTLMTASFISVAEDVIKPWLQLLLLQRLLLHIIEADRANSIVMYMRVLGRCSHRDDQVGERLIDRTSQWRTCGDVTRWLSHACH